MADGFPEHPVHRLGLKVEGVGKSAGPEPDLVPADVHPWGDYRARLVLDKESAVAREAGAAAQPADVAAARRKPDAALSAA
jgi:hypothetical protein